MNPATASTDGLLAVMTEVSQRVAVEDRLERGMELYRALARHTPTGFVLAFDQGLRHFVADGGGLAAFGSSREDLEGRTAAEALPESVAAQLEPRCRAALDGRTSTWERRHGPRTFRLTAGPVRDAGGAIFAGMVSGEDVTQLRHGEAMNMALSQLATAVARHASRSVVFRQLAESLRDLFDVSTSAVAHFEVPGQAGVVAAAPHLPGTPSVITFGEGDERHSALAAVHRSGRAALVTPGRTPGSLGSRLRAAGIVATAAAPIRVSNRLWGALALGTGEEDRLHPDTLAQLGDFAELAELAVSNAQAWEELRRDASTDALTGLANHRTFQERLRQEVARSDRHDRPLSLVLFDIDFFKRVNDTHGHQVGDHVLAEVARRMMGVLRDGEQLARIGGEEFAWLLPETGSDAAVLAAERLRHTIAADPIPVAGTITASAGVCDLRQAGSAERLNQLADQALYTAKQRGRNRTCRHDDAVAAREAAA